VERDQGELAVQVQRRVIEGDGHPGLRAGLLARAGRSRAG
jgi:hypothetical protein